MGLQQQSKPMSQKKKADIIFCIDNSGSMSECIAGVRNTVGSFVSSLESGVEGQSPVDWQIGLISYSHEEYLFLDLSKDTSGFKNTLSKSVNGWNEFTPGAVDYAISNASWREGAQRVIVIFTDENLEGGDGGGNRFDELLTKICNSHLQIVYYGPHCPYYERFFQCPNAEVNVVENFSGVQFNTLMTRLAVTISSTSPFSGKDQVSKELVYSTRGIKVIKA